MKLKDGRTPSPSAYDNIKPILVEKGSGSHSNNFFPERK